MRYLKRKTSARLMMELPYTQKASRHPWAQGSFVKVQTELDIWPVSGSV